MASDCRLFVGNLADQVTEDLLYELFLQVGPVNKVTHPNKKNGQAARFAFVDFVHPESVGYAIQVLDGIKLFGEHMRLNPSGNDGAVHRICRPPSGDHNHHQSSTSPSSSHSHSSSRSRPESHRSHSRHSQDRSHGYERSHHSLKQSHHSNDRSHDSRRAVHGDERPHHDSDQSGGLRYVGGINRRRLPSPSSRYSRSDDEQWHSRPYLQNIEKPTRTKTVLRGKNRYRNVPYNGPVDLFSQPFKTMGSNNQASKQQQQ